MTNSEVDAKTGPKEQYWLKPEQVQRIRNAAYDASPTYLQARDDAIIATLYHTGLRVGELVQLDTAYLDFADRALFVPAHIQKDYPNAGSPSKATIGLDGDTTRTLRAYLNGRWKDSPALFPSRSSDRMSERAVVNVVHKLAEEAGVEPMSTTGDGDPSDVTPHTFRHSVAYRMVRREGTDFHDVKRRLRHATVLTTEREYAHFEKV